MSDFTTPMGNRGFGASWSPVLPDLTKKFTVDWVISFKADNTSGNHLFLSCDTTANLLTKSITSFTMESDWLSIDGSNNYVASGSKIIELTNSVVGPTQADYSTVELAIMCPLFDFAEVKNNFAIKLRSGSISVVEL